MDYFMINEITNTNNARNKNVLQESDGMEPLECSICIAACNGGSSNGTVWEESLIRKIICRHIKALKLLGLGNLSRR